MKPLIILIVTLLFLCSYRWTMSIGLSELKTITTNEGRSIDYFLFERGKRYFPLIITVTTLENHSVVSFLDSIYQPVEKFTLPAKGFSRSRSFSLNSILYIFLDRLYVIDVTTGAVDSIQLELQYYHTVDYQVLASDTLIIASSPDKIHLYSFPEFKLNREIDRKEYRQLDFPVIFGDMFIFQNQDNELAVYGRREEKMICKFNSAEQPVYFLGIQIGYFDDTVSCYRINKENHKFKLYYATFSGCLFISDPMTGDTLQYKSRFRGSTNNAGLLTSFEIVDLDKNGIPDIVATSVDNKIYGISGKDLDPLWMYDTGGENQMPLSLYDITGDNIPDIFGINDNMVLTILNGRDGEMLLSKQLDQKGYQSCVGLADLDSDGGMELIVNLGRKAIKIYKLRDINVKRNKVIWIPKL